MPVGVHRLRTTTLDKLTRAGLSEISGQKNVRGTSRDNTGLNIRDIHPVPGKKLKFLTPLEIESGPPGWKAGTLPTKPRRRDGPIRNLEYKNYRI